MKINTSVCEKEKEREKRERKKARKRGRGGGRKEGRGEKINMFASNNQSKLFSIYYKQ